MAREELSGESGDGEQYECDWPGCDYKSASKRGVSIHHKRTHGESIAGTEIECEWCGETTRVQPSTAEDRRFCSYDCRYEWMASGAMSGENHPSWKGRVTLTCEQCGEKFDVKPHRVGRARFCSTQCLWDWRSENEGGESHYLWKGGEVTLTCEQCGGDFNVRQYRVGRARFCSAACADDWKSDNFTGPQNPLWNGGVNLYRRIRALLPRLWSTAKRETRDRDEHRCQMCGTEEEDLYRDLDVNHIIPILSGGDNDDYNLISLCPSCHKRADNYITDILYSPFQSAGN